MNNSASFHLRRLFPRPISNIAGIRRGPELGSFLSILESYAPAMLCDPPVFLARADLTLLPPDLEVPFKGAVIAVTVLQLY